MLPPKIKTIYDPRSGTATHVVYEAPGLPCAVIDPVFDLDPRSGHTSEALLDQVVDFIRAERLSVAWILETHVHHDHLSGAARLQHRVGGRIGTGMAFTEVEQAISRVYDLPPLCCSPEEPAPFDALFQDGEMIAVGPLELIVLHTPGHTLDHVSYRVGDAIFTGDTVFMPDSGTARCDFYRGDARLLYRSIQRLLAHPPETRLFLCHDYGAGGERPPAWETTVAAQQAANIHLRGGGAEDAFVAIRTERDCTLAAPALMLPSLQVNIRGGRLPPMRANGTVYLAMPLDVPGHVL